MLGRFIFVFSAVLFFLTAGHSNAARILFDWPAPGGSAERFGHEVSRIGDIDFDGVRDLAISSPFSKDDGIWVGIDTGPSAFSGEVKFVSGATGETICKSQVGEIYCQIRLDQLAGAIGHGLFGRRVEDVGDINGDGVNDIGIGMSHALSAGFDHTPKGRMIILSGFDFRILFDQAEMGYFAWDFAGLGDLDGDGNAEFAIGYPYRADYLEGGSVGLPGYGEELILTGEVPDPGMVLIYRGFADLGYAMTESSLAVGSGGKPVQVLLGHRHRDFFGDSVIAGDPDRDGRVDVLVGADQKFYEEMDGDVFVGEGYVERFVFERGNGPSGEFSGQFKKVQRWSGAGLNDRFGKTLAWYGKDFLVGAPGNGGRVYLHSLRITDPIRSIRGSDYGLDGRFGEIIEPLGSVGFMVGAPDAYGTGVLSLVSEKIWIPEPLTLDPEPGSEFGYSVAPLKDFDSDGVPELAVGVPGANEGDGKVLVYSLR